MINDAISFVRGHTSEFLILRFSHTKCPEQVADVLEQIYDSNCNDQFILTGDSNIAQARLANLRGKVIMIFDNKFNKQRLQTYDEKKWYRRGAKQKQGRGLGAKRMHLFTKYSAGKPPGNGICTCGSFASTDNMAKVEKNRSKLSRRIATTAALRPYLLCLLAIDRRQRGAKDHIGYRHSCQNAGFFLRLYEELRQRSSKCNFARLRLRRQLQSNHPF